jgi:hypothetical protein
MTFPAGTARSTALRKRVNSWWRSRHGILRQSEHHEYELYLALEDVDHTRTKTKSPQTTDVIDKCFLAGSELFSSRAWVTAR